MQIPYVHSSCKKILFYCFSSLFFFSSSLIFGSEGRKQKRTRQVLEKKLVKIKETVQNNHDRIKDKVVSGLDSLVLELQKELR